MKQKELLIEILCIAIFFGFGLSIGYCIGKDEQGNYVTREEVHQILDSVLVDIFD